MELFVVIFISLFGACSSINRFRPDEGAEWSDAYLDAAQLIQKYKYPAEVHHITTEDGYILTLHRIPYGRTCPKERSRGPIIVQHGILSSSIHFIIAGTKTGLGYILADNCFDVWLPNNRGNSYSIAHQSLNTNSKEYWDFSWHEMGLYDYPAIFQYVLDKSGANDVSFIAHSQGTTAFFVFNEFHPEYTDKIRAAFLLAPISYLGHSRSYLLQIAARFENLLQTVANNFGIYRVVQHDDALTKMIAYFCTLMGPSNPAICSNLLFLVTGPNSEQTNLTLISITIRSGLYGTAIKQLLHFAQLLESHEFQQYNYGPGNMRRYGQHTPPKYDLSKVTAPIHLYCAKNDWLSDLRDVKKLMDQLPNVREYNVIKSKKYNHLNHLFAIGILPLEYDHLIQTLDGYYNDTGNRNEFISIL